MRRLVAVIGSAVFLVVAPGTVAGLLPFLICRWRLAPPLLGFTPFRIVGVALILGGAPMLLDSFARFALQGMGTPAPILPTRRLVVTGLYRYVRNPMYVAVLSVIVGQGLFFGSAGVLLYAIAVGLGFHLFVMSYEEVTLRRTFPVEYDVFCANVPRWIPRVHPWEPPGLNDVAAGEKIDER